MNIELLRQLSQRLLAPHGSQGHLRFESRRVVPAWSSAHRFSCSAAILAAVRQRLHLSNLFKNPEPALFDAQDRIAPRRLKPIIDRAVNAGVHILVANGNTGEFYGLTTAEAEQMVHAVAEEIGGRVPLLAGVGRSIGDACALAKASRAAGASALMVHQPPDPFVSPRGVIAYVERVAEAGGGLPLMLYLRNDGIGLDTIERLCKVQGVAGGEGGPPPPLWRCRGGPRPPPPPPPG